MSKRELINRKRRNYLLVVLVGVVSILSLAMVFVGTTPTPAHADNCTAWMRQSDGTYWMTCVDDNGNQYCYWADQNGQNVTRVSCR